MHELTLGQTFHEMWDLSRDYETRRANFESLVDRCIERAAAGEQCEFHDCRDYPIAKFVCALQDDAYAPTLARVFSAFLQAGLLDPNKPLQTSVASLPNYKSMHGDLPLVHAVLKGNIHAAELLVLHGADTAARVSDNVGGFLGEDFFDFVRLHFGETHYRRPTPNERAAAAARLLQAAMTCRLSDSPAPQAASSPARRRRSV